MATAELMLGEHPLTLVQLTTVLNIQGCHTCLVLIQASGLVGDEADSAGLGASFVICWQPEPRRDIRIRIHS